MEGSVLHFSYEAGEGVIRASDGRRYTFEAKQWLSSPGPTVGDGVDFEPEGAAAGQIYRLAGGAAPHPYVYMPPPPAPFPGSKASVVAACLMILGTFLPWISVSYSGHVSLWGITEYLRMLAGLASYGRGSAGGATLVVYLFLLPFYLVPFFAARLIYKEARGTATPGLRRRVGLYGLLAPWVMVLIAYMILASALNPRGSPGGIGNPLAIISVVGGGWYLVMGCGIALTLIASSSPRPYLGAVEPSAPAPSPSEISALALAPAPPPPLIAEPEAAPAQAPVADTAIPAAMGGAWADGEVSRNRNVAIVAAIALVTLILVGIILAAGRGSGPAVRNDVASADPVAIAPASNETMMSTMPSAPTFSVTSSTIEATPASGGPATVTAVFYYSNAAVGSGYSCGLSSFQQWAGTLPTQSGWVRCSWQNVQPGQYYGSLSVGGVTTPTRELIIPAAAPPQAAALEPQAQQFAERYFTSWSSSDSEALAFLENAYPGTVTFYGREVASAAVMRDKRAFVARWPERNYVIDPATLSVACNAGTRRCTVSGNVNFRCRNQLRNETSVGVASFSFEMLFPELGRSLIMAESSQLISRVRN